MTERVREHLEWMVAQENLTFAECSIAEEWVRRAKEALADLVHHRFVGQKFADLRCECGAKTWGQALAEWQAGGSPIVPQGAQWCRASGSSAGDGASRHINL